MMTFSRYSSRNIGMADYCESGQTGDKIRSAVLSLLKESPSGITPHELYMFISRSFKISPHAAKKCLKNLVERSEIEYFFSNGRCIINISYNRPVRVSDHLVIAPPGVDTALQPGEKLLYISRGSAFGDGRHPTTRLCLQVIDMIVCERISTPQKVVNMIDIGTGSGILGLATLRLGVERAIGIDIDPCAIYEAELNAQINNLTGRFQVMNMTTKEIRQEFDLVVANLRLPGLKKIFTHVAKISKPGAIAVLSGIHSDEIEDLATHYRKFFSLQWHCTENDWSALILKRRPQYAVF